MMHPSRPRTAAAVTGAATLLAGLLVPAAATADEHDIFISEIHYDNDGTDTGEAIEVQAPVGTDLTGWTLELYNGSNNLRYDTDPVGGVVPESGVLVVDYPRDGLQNGARDAMALVDDAGTVVEFLSYEGTLTAADGSAAGQTSTDIGVSEGSSTPVGHSLQVVDGAWTGPAPSSFGAVNTAPDPEEPHDPGSCSDPATPVAQVQGDGASSPLEGQTVTVEGTVVGDFQHSGSYRGYYVQDAGDGNAATSDGVFVFDRGTDVSVGDVVRVTGEVEEYYDLTEIAASQVDVCAAGQDVPTATELTMPLGDLEPYEGMLVTFPQELAILEYYNYARYGEIVIGTGVDTERQFQPTAVHEPGSSQAQDLLAYNLSHRIMLDDGLGVQNPEFLRHPDGNAFTLDNRFRGGDTLTDVTGVLDYRYSEWGVQPTQGAVHTVRNLRPDVPEVGGTTTVASFNVLNYFTTLREDDRDARGADDMEEFERQEAKIVAAITAMDADVVGLIEIENNGDVAVGTLVEALNEAAGEERWAFVSTGVVGTDAITTAFIYQPAQVSPVGDFAVLDSSVDARFNDEKNRPALAQTFEENLSGAQFTVVNNHLKSKGSDCDELADPDTGDGAGNCNLTRAAAADALGDWASSDPTGTGTEEVLIIGDLNSYDKEDPIDALRADGFVDLLHELQGEYAYSYVFDGMLGYLDYAMASPSLVDNVTGAAAWAINADEPSVLDYDLTYKPDAQDALYAPDPYRSSDHDPVIVGLDLDNVAPEVDAFAEPPHIWPANGKWRNVTTVVEATDNLDDDLTITLVGAESSDGGDVRRIDDARFRVLAVLGAEYTFTYKVTDDSGNTTTVTLTVTVEKPGQGPRD